MHPLAIEFICVLGMPPVAFVELARSLGIGSIGLGPQPITANPHGYPGWNLLEDAALRREVKSALAANGVTVALGEGFLLRADTDPATLLPLLDLFADLGAPRVNAVAMGAPPALFGRFAELADARGMTACLEFLPLMPPATLDAALAYLDDSGSRNARVTVDAMHFFRSKGRIETLTAVPPLRIGHAQICDVPMPATIRDYGLEARAERLCPGAGDLPLADFLRALPQGITVGLEVPETAKAQAGISPAERLAPVVAAARALLESGG